MTIYTKLYIMTIYNQLFYVLYLKSKGYLVMYVYIFWKKRGRSSNASSEILWIYRSVKSLFIFTRRA